MSYLPENDKLRKGLPLLKFMTGYMPRAIREMTKVSVVNNVRYNPDRDPADINWNRAKSKDQLGSLQRHIMEREVDGKIFEEVPKDIAEKTGIERVYVLAEAAWRACAALELEIERVEGVEQHAVSKLDAIRDGGILVRPHTIWTQPDAPEILDYMDARGSPGQAHRPCKCDRCFHVDEENGWFTPKFDGAPSSDTALRLHTLERCDTPAWADKVMDRQTCGWVPLKSAQA